MRFRYFICDVFTDTRFGGNQLAVFPDASEIPSEAMQQIAREFNFSETTFVLPAEAGNTRRVRIFTPTNELPFAGHPNIGTAHMLAAAGEFGVLGATTKVVFEELAGLVEVSIDALAGSPTRCQLEAPQSLSLGAAAEVEQIAAAVSLSPADIVIDRHVPQTASVGLPFLICELVDVAALARARVDPAAFAAMGPDVPRDVYLYARCEGVDAGGFDVRARMFAPFGGVPEDPATGSAGCTLAGLLAHFDPRPTGEFAWTIGQGIEMGRPSRLEASALKTEGTVVATRVAGSSILVSEGWLELD